MARGSSADSGLVDRLIEAATGCFERSGVSGTRIEDVAQAADVSRATFYRYFETREQLVDAVVLAQLQAIVDRFGDGIREAASLDSALVGGSVDVLLACRQNVVFMQLLHHARGRRLSDLATGTSAFFSPVAEALWGPAIAAARERGELPPDLPAEDIIRWIASVHLLLLLRMDLDADAIEWTVARFVVPAILVSAS